MAVHEPLIDIEEAYRRLLSVVQPVPTVELALQEALHRTLAAPVRCDLDSPPFDRAMMDGYAVRAVDTAETPVRLRVIGELAAGAVADLAVGSCEAMQINTGAPIPSGADAVVRVENTERSVDGETVVINGSVPTGKFITQQATYASAGATVLEAGTRLTPINIGAAATAGAARVSVYRAPQVALLATGDELVDIDCTPSGAQIRNSNQYLLDSLVRAAHAEPIPLGAAKDAREVLRSRIEEGLQYDMLCITGGVSMGAFDFVPEILRQCGATFHIRKIAIKPGRPTIVATAPSGSLIFALPGNPMGAFVVFELLVRPALAALEGRTGVIPSLILARLRGSIEQSTDRRSYRPIRAWVDDDGQWVAEPLSWHGSGDSLGGATANALCVHPPWAGKAKTGDSVRILMLDRV